MTMNNSENQALVPSALRDRIAVLFRYAEVGRCVSSVTHDINNLLGAIMAYAELTRLDDGISDESRRMLNEVVNAVRRAGDLVSGLTDIARKERQDLRIVDPARLLERVVDLRRYDIKAARIDLGVEAPTGLPNLTIQFQRLLQSMLYILTNAMEAVERCERKRLMARVYADRSHVAFAFRDSHPPINGECRQRMFEPFYTTKGPEHLGLGLTMARAIARDHGGDLTYDPQLGFVLRVAVDASPA
jgi:C4-dicarboxylate-specific signal transduction histidine kinase